MFIYINVNGQWIFHLNKIDQIQQIKKRLNVQVYF
jgi:hypothetical protein